MSFIYSPSPCHSKPVWLSLFCRKVNFCSTGHFQYNVDECGLGFSISKMTKSSIIVDLFYKSVQLTWFMSSTIYMVTWSMEVTRRPTWLKILLLHMEKESNACLNDGFSFWGYFWSNTCFYMCKNILNVLSSWLKTALYLCFRGFLMFWYSFGCKLHLPAAKSHPQSVHAGVELNKDLHRLQTR